MKMINVGLKIILVGIAAVAMITAEPLAASANSRVPRTRCSAYAGTGRHTVLVHLVRGGPAKTEHGCLKTISDRYDYLFTARKGAVLTTKIKGAATRLVGTFPDGTVNGPGFPETLRLPQTGRYRVEVSPDQMADGALGFFAITFRLR